MEKPKSLVQTFELLEKNKLPLANFKVLETKNDLKKMNFPIYIKIDSQKHKSKLGGVKKCNTFHEALKTTNMLLKKFPNTLLILQEEIQGKEIFVGIKKDKVFGEVLVVGAGGTRVESKKDLSFRALPINKREASKMIRELKIYQELRKQNKQAIKELLKIISKISKLAQALQPKELDLNPVILTKNKANIVDARIF
ncbi:hypothetical protein CMI41_02235 [Candidatus Pacearchaeota archaeon]|nr:hypothetical protein [Candidatus Pacearchaeota archaeon]|tara:strand:+ start:65 stop:655 length:591 start_codon:yes stop_codon:yes gene_type:complete